MYPLLTQTYLTAYTVSSGTTTEPETKMPNKDNEPLYKHPLLNSIKTLEDWKKLYEAVAETTDSARGWEVFFRDLIKVK